MIVKRLRLRFLDDQIDAAEEELRKVRRQLRSRRAKRARKARARKEKGS